MKKSIITLLILMSILSINAQEGFHEHDGFYLSMSLGPVFGNIKDDMGSVTMDITGTGMQFDFKIGGRISENLLLHGTIISSVLPGPTVKLSNNTTFQTSNSMSVGEAMIGAGLTYYVMPSNIFFSGSVGLGNFTILDDKNDIDVSTQRGLSFQVKLGKEWWISKNWGFGIGLTYSKTNLTNKPDDGTSEKLDSNRFAILFNTTFN